MLSRDKNLDNAALTEQYPEKEASFCWPKNDKAAVHCYRNSISYLFFYTILFVVTASAVFVWFYLENRRFVWRTDGVNQHYYGLVFFSRWGKEILRHFFEEGDLCLPTFSLRIGYGSDLYSTLAYYVIGDPFSLPAVLVPEKDLLLFHDLMLLVRFWAAGIAFSAYCFYMRPGFSRLGVLAGTFVYIFNGFTMSGMRHHYFLNPFIFFPLLLIGCEKILRNKKPWMFVFMVFLSAVSNFYFFYIMVLMTVLYVLWRLFRTFGFRQPGKILQYGVKYLYYGTIGTLLSAFVFYPIILRFLQDPRASDKKNIPIFWPAEWYRNFPGCFLLSGPGALADSWTYMGFGAVAALCILLVFMQKKRHFDQKAAFVCLTCILLTPVGGYILNGFSYPANRWMWAYALLIGYMTATAVFEANILRERLHFFLFVLAAIACELIIFSEKAFRRSTIQVFITGITVLTILTFGRLFMLKTESPERKHRVLSGVQAGMLICVLLTAVFGGYASFSPKRYGKVFQYLSRAQIETQTAKDAAAAKELIDGNLLKNEREESVPFYRYTTYNPENNTSMLYGVSNTQYYWSLSNPDVSQFLNETGQLNRMVHLYDTLDDRTYLNEIAAVRYFLGNDEEGVPFGYIKKEGLFYTNAGLWPDEKKLDRFSCELYENKYALPFGFTTDRWISREDYDRMDIPQRQQALLQGVVLEQNPGQEYRSLKTKEMSFTEQRLPADIEFDGKKLKSGTKTGPLSFERKGDNREVSVSFQGLPDCETGLYIRGLSYKPPEGRSGSTRFLLSTTGYRGEKKVVSKQIGFTTQMDPWTTGRKDFLVNLRYNKEPLDRIEISLPARGTFSCDSIEVVCQPMETYPALTENLQKNCLTELDIHEMGESGSTDRITGHINLKESRILCLQIPREKGWTAYVDGSRADLLRADTMFSALLLPKGSHDIELRYRTPGLFTGMVVSSAAFTLVVMSVLVRKLSGRKHTY